MSSLLIAALLSYLIGSIPFSLLLGRVIGGIDLRRIGSGNVGATNLGRALGFRWFLVALLLDALKGLFPTYYFPLWLHADAGPGFTHLAVLSGVSAMLGHLFPCWLGFRGGKGVATALGVVCILSPAGTLAALVVFLLLFAWKRTVSIGSIGAVTAFAIYQCVTGGSALWSAEHWSLGAFSVLAPLLIILMHHSNIRRLLRGEEPTSSTPVESDPPLQ